MYIKYLAILLLIAGCASNPTYYKWEETHESAKVINWHYIVDQDSFDKLCGISNKPGLRIAACAWVWNTTLCSIYTWMNLPQTLFAKDPDGISIKEHEEKHCAGWSHQ